MFMRILFLLVTSLVRSLVYFIK